MMKNILMVAAVSAFLVGCSPQPSQQPAVDAEGLQVAEVIPQEDFTTKWFSAPITRLYAPGFDHHFRAVTRSQRNNGMIRIRQHMEILNVSQQDAAQILDSEFSAAGYSKRGGEWNDNGVYSANYRKRGTPTVYVLIQDNSEGQDYDFGSATGVLRVSWNYRPETSKNK